MKPPDRAKLAGIVALIVAACSMWIMYCLKQ